MQIMISKGRHGTQVFENEQFEMVKEPAEGKRGWHVTVIPNKRIGGDHGVIRVKIDSPNVIKYVFDEELSKNSTSQMSDDTLLQEITERFDILDEMTYAAISGTIRGLIVIGPPGVGKSYGVHQQLEKYDMLNAIADKPLNHIIVKGSITAIGLYCLLYQYSESRNVVLFDDCDMIFNDEITLNLLKAALDSNKTRRLFWNSDSYKLKNTDTPESFEFNGSVIFITNVGFDTRSKKIRDHLSALESRCHFLDMKMETVRERFLRIKQIHSTGDLFKNYYFQNDEGDQIIQFMEDNQDKLHEISLRMAIKIADLVRITPTHWKNYAKKTTMR